MTPRLRPRSLIARILLAELGAILFVALLLPAAMIWLLRQQMSHFEAQTLADQAQEIARRIDAGPARLTVGLAPQLAQTYATPYDGRAYVIADAGGAARAQSPFARLIPWQDAPRTDRTRSFRIASLVGVSMPITVDHNDLWVIVTQDERGPGAILDDVMRAFITRYSPLLAIVLLLLPVLNSLLVRRLVVAVSATSERAGKIGPNSLDLRLEPAGLPTEIEPLAKAVNDLLVRLQQSFEQQSQFVANVAHELRTPLTTLKFELETLDDVAARARLGTTVDRLGHVVAQLQALAALEASAIAFEEFDLAALAQEVIAALAPRIFAAGDTVAFQAPDRPVRLRGNRTLIGVALSNLLSNASQHTPSGTAIEVRITDRREIQVTDDGPGVASSDPSEARLRYWRADNQRSDSAGLGLSIVARIVEVHGGQLVIQNLEKAGACFSMRFGDERG